MPTDRTLESDATIPPPAPAPKGSGDLNALDMRTLDVLPPPRPGQAPVLDLPRGPPPQQAGAPPGYEILGELGRGGMGVVYKARQRQLDRVVALKMILTGVHAAPEELARFRREAEAVAQLQHPHIVQIHDVGDHDGQPYLALEFVDGGSLADRIAGKPGPALRAAQMVETLARAMHVAHQRGVVHRDLKPANVLLTTDGTPKISDFGLAKRLGAPAGGAADCHTETGALLGTPSYMSPEQAGGKTREIGPAADTYALGSILYELLTGRPPFLGETALDTVQQVVGADPVPVRRLQPTVPRDLETVCLKCLEKPPTRRYASALDLAEDLHRFQEGEPIRARPVGTLGRLAKWARRRPAVAALSAAVVLIALTGLGLVTWEWQEAEEARAAAEREKRTAEAAERRAVEKADAEARARTQADLAQRSEARQRAAAETQLYLSSVALAHREWLANHTGRAVELLNECPRAHRQWEWHYLKRQLDASLHTLVGVAKLVTTVAFSPDGKHLAAACPDQRAVHLWDADTGQLLHKFGGPRYHVGKVTAAAFSPDAKGAGRWHVVSASADGTVHFWDAVRGGAKPVRTFRHRAGVVALAVSPDGTRLALARGDRVVTVLDLGTGKELFALPSHAGALTAVVFSPDGRFLASADEGSSAAPGARTVQVWDARTGKESVALQGAGASVTALAFSPDGEHLAASALDFLIRIYDTGTGKRVDGGTLAGHGHAVAAVAYDRDGRLASASFDQSVKVWAARTYRELLTLRGHDMALSGVAFRPDGLRLASADRLGTVKIWDAVVAPDAATVGFPGTNSACVGVAFRPDGARVLTAVKTLVYAWDLTRRRQSAVYRGHTEDVNALAHSGDGRFIASADAGGMVRLRDAATGRELHALRGGSGQHIGPRQTPAAALAFSPDAGRLTWADTGGAVTTWDTASGRELFRRSLWGQDLWSVALSPDGRHLAWGDTTGTVRIRDLTGGAEVLTLRGPALRVGAVAFDPTGRYLASADREVRLWDLATGRQARAFTGHALIAADYLAFSPDGRRLASTSWDSTARLWDVNTGRELLTLRGPNIVPRGLGFSPDGRRLAAASNGGLKIWDATPSREVTRRVFSDIVMGLTFSPDGTRLACAEQLTVNVWEPASGRAVLLLPWRQPGADAVGTPGRTDIPVAVAFSPDGALLAAGGGTARVSGEVKLWDARTGALLRALRGHGATVFSVSFSADGREGGRLRLASASHDKTVKVWDAVTGKELLTFRGHSDAVNAIAFDPLGRWVASGGRDKRVKIWADATGEQIRTLDGHNGSITAVAVSPDGTRLAAASAPRAGDGDGEVVVWDVASGQRVLTFRRHAGVLYAVAFSPDGRLVASAGSDQTVRVWDGAIGRELLVLRGHHSTVTRVTFSPTGNLLASSSQDRTVRVWDVSGLDSLPRPGEGASGRGPAARAGQE